MEASSFGPLSFIIVWWCVASPAIGQYQDMVCDATGPRKGRMMSGPGPECDLDDRGWCTVKTANYPEEMIMEVILDNRGIMKRLFGDQRDARFLQAEFSNALYEDPARPPPPNLFRKVKKKPRAPKGVTAPRLRNGRYPDTEILASARHGKKIDGGRPKGMNGLRHSGLKEDLKGDDKKDLKDDLKEDLKGSGQKASSPSPAVAPSRHNDKVFSDTFDLQVKASNDTRPLLADTDTNVTTTTPLTFNDDLDDKTTTLAVEDLSDDSFTTETLLPFEESSQVTTPMTNTEESNRPVTSSTTTTSEESVAYSHNKSADALKEKKTFPRSTVPPLDSGDELSYNSKSVPREVVSPSASVTEEPPSLRSGLTQDEEAKDKSDEFLKGRVELHTRYTPSQNRRNGAPSYVRRPAYQSRPQSQPQAHSRRRPQTPPSRTPPSRAPPSRAPPSREPPPLRERTDFPIPPPVNEDFVAHTEKPNPPIPVFPMEKFPACNSTSELIAPTWAKNMQGKNLIVVNVGSFMQHLHVEECDKDALYRKMFCQRGCRCEQQYRLQKLLVIDPDDECRGIFSDWFRFPSCCVCVCYPVSLRSSNRNGRIMDDDYDEDDYYEDDLDDPIVRHYYGLDKLPPKADLEEEEIEETDEIEEIDGDEDEEEGRWEEEGWKEEEWNDVMEAEATVQKPTYTSFTDIDSIDRSFSVESTPIERRENAPINTTWIITPNLFGEQTTPAPKPFPANVFVNSTISGEKREKKSRLLKGFSRTVNVRPQIPPRRIPPPRASAPSYGFPWRKSPTLSIWPSLAVYKQFPSIRNYNAIPSRPRQFDRLPTKNRMTTPDPREFQSTLGTLNAATPPFYNWHQKSRMKSVSRNGRENSFLLSRIPRATETGGN